MLRPPIFAFRSHLFGLLDPTMSDRFNWDIWLVNLYLSHGLVDGLDHKTIDLPNKCAQILWPVGVDYLLGY